VLPSLYRQAGQEWPGTSKAVSAVTRRSTNVIFVQFTGNGDYRPLDHSTVVYEGPEPYGDGGRLWK
jgi:hypothetical protein